MRSSSLRWHVAVAGDATAYGYRFLVAGAADGTVWLDSESLADKPTPPKRKSPSASSASSSGSAVTPKKSAAPTTPAMEGKLVVELFGARQLIKADLIGKSDPYAVLKLGSQIGKTKTINNSLVRLLKFYCLLYIYKIVESYCSGDIFCRFSKSESCAHCHLVAGATLGLQAGVSSDQGVWPPAQESKPARLFFVKGVF